MVRVSMSQVSLFKIKQAPRTSPTSQDLTPTRVLPNDAAAGSAASLAPQVSQSRKRTVRKAIDSLAVMPLVNESKDPVNKPVYSKASSTVFRNFRIRVTARSTVLLGDRGVDPQEVGNHLGVRAVLRQSSQCQRSLS